MTLITARAFNSYISWTGRFTLCVVVMRYPEHALVVLASTLAGGVTRVVHYTQDGGAGNRTCGTGSTWAECSVLDEGISPLHVLIPWLFTLGVLVVLSMPTVLLRSKHKERGLGLIAWMFMQLLALMLSSTVFTDHPALTFTLSLHACVRLLTRLRVSEWLVGGAMWWSLRYLGVALLLCWEVFAGAPVSIVRWAAEPPEGLPCAYLAHLGGCIVPDLTLLLLHTLMQGACCFCAFED